MKKNQKERLLSMVEGAIMVALAVVLDYLCGLIPFKPFPYGGSISIAVLPLIYYTYRRGAAWGLGTAFVFSVIQLVTGWYPPPAGTWWAFILCVLLDYFLAFTTTGCAGLVAKAFGRHRLVGYAAGSAVVGIGRFLCSFFSGVILWDSYAPEGMSVWLYSLIYNGGYMLPNTVMITVLIVLLCVAIDPLTLRRMKKGN